MFNRTHGTNRRRPNGIVAGAVVAALALGGLACVPLTGCTGGSDATASTSSSQSSDQTQSAATDQTTGNDQTTIVQNEGQDNAVAVPDVTGQNQDDATKALQDVGLTANVQWQESAQRYPQVVATDPVAGTKVIPGQTVTVYVASPGARSELYLSDYMVVSRDSQQKYLSWKGWTQAMDAGTWVEWHKDGCGILEFGKGRMQIDEAPDDPPAQSYDFVGFRPYGTTADDDPIGYWVTDYPGDLSGPTASLAYLAKAEKFCGFSDPIAHYDVGEAPNMGMEGYRSVSEIGRASDRSYWFVMEEDSPYKGTHRVVMQVARKDLVGSDPQEALKNFYVNEHVG
ncbi:MAG: PASTA domain-containing protein [Atopobiaceae bacterium]